MLLFHALSMHKLINTINPFRVHQKAEQPVFTITKDGDYHFTFIMQPLVDGQDFTANVHIEMRSSYGYLSAVDYPLLIVRSQRIYLFM